ncbi:MAG: hypothetical protein ACRC18_06905 [Cetobacterium sp.]
MRFYKKSDKIMVCKINGETKIVAFSTDIDVVKSDIRLFNSIIKPIIKEIIMKYKYSIAFGSGYNFKIIGYDDLDKFIYDSKVKPFIGGFLHSNDLELIKNLIRLKPNTKLMINN